MMEMYSYSIMEYVFIFYKVDLIITNLSLSISILNCFIFYLKNGNYREFSTVVANYAFHS